LQLYEIFITAVYELKLMSQKSRKLKRDKASYSSYTLEDRFVVGYSVIGSREQLVIDELQLAM
jgi:hypothetical protein